jgi:ankyrin repeat protein
VSAIQTVLVSGVNVDAGTTSSVLTPLYIACMFGNVNAARLLIEAGADKDKAMNDGATPLQIARWSQHDDIVEMLQRAGATG